MWIDPIVEEVRKIRQQHAQKFNNDLNAIIQDLQKNEKQRIMQGWEIRSPKLPQNRKKVTVIG